jgi:hypothetical protein
MLTFSDFLCLPISILSYSQSNPIKSLQVLAIAKKITITLVLNLEKIVGQLFNLFLYFNEKIALFD